MREAVFPGAKMRLHWSLPDPSAVTGEGRMGTFRQVRDRIRALISSELLEAKGEYREKAEGAVPVHPELREEPDGRRFLRHLVGDRFEVISGGLAPTDEIHPCAVQAMAEVGIDISDQRLKRLGAFLGREFFNYLVIVCARAEERCPKTFPGVGARFSWIFDDPRSDEGLPYDSMLERFRQVRNEIEIRVKDWLENPEAELERLRESRERERRERLAGGQSSSHSG